MNSQLPKVLHKVGGKSMLAHVLSTSKKLGADKIIIVHGHGGELVQQALSDQDIEWVEQKERLGTGHAIQQAIPAFSMQEDENILVLYGDVPLVSAETLEKLLTTQTQNSLAVLTTKVNNPGGYGRIVRGVDGKVQKIVEEQEASKEIKEIDEINTGILSATSKSLTQWLKKIDNNNQQNEYYLTDCVGLAVSEGKNVAAVICPDYTEVMGVNNCVQLAQTEAIFQQRQRNELMLKGVTLRDPATTYIEGNLDIGSDIVIEPNVLLRGTVKIGDNVTIGINSVVIDTEIASGTTIYPNTHIENATIGHHCELGPYARIRPQTQLADHVKLGNFVEIKKSKIKSGSKVNHLSYIGDASIGKETNIGAGTICCNYDGVNKHKTIIGNRVFIGSDTQLVAPVTIEDGATIGAGSTITKNVPAEKLTLSRNKQTTIENWRRPAKKK